MAFVNFLTMCKKYWHVYLYILLWSSKKCPKKYLKLNILDQKDFSEEEFSYESHWVYHQQIALAQFCSSIACKTCTSGIVDLVANLPRADPLARFSQQNKSWHFVPYPQRFASFSHTFLKHSRIQNPRPISSFNKPTYF